MVTRDDLEQLVKNRGQEAVGAAVVKIPDEDVRPALMLMVMIYQKSDEINREIFRRDQKRIAGAWAKSLLLKRDFTGSEAVSLLLIFRGFDSYST